MIETEKAILAAAIEHPKHIRFILENCDVEFFQNINNQEIFKVIKERHERKELVDWNTVIDLLWGKVKPSYLTLMLTDGARGTPSHMMEGFILEKISLIKAHRGKRRILEEISRQAQFARVDFEKIIELAEEGKAIKLIQEKADFKTAYEAYVDWKGRKPTNIKTGFPSLDNLTDDFNYGEIVSFMARTVVGKTFVSLNVLDKLIGNIEDKIGFFSLEMSKASLVERMMQIHFKLSRWDLKRARTLGGLDDEELLAKFKDLNIYSKIYSAYEIASIVKRDELKVIFIDYLQIMKKGDGNSLYEKTSYRMQELKEMAKNEEVVIFLLIQISRKGEGGWEPVTIDMARDSGAIEENSDFIIGMWSPSLKEGTKPEWKNVLCMKLLKNKRGPGLGIKCNFNELSGKIYELDYKESHIGG